MMNNVLTSNDGSNSNTFWGINTTPGYIMEDINNMMR